VSTWSVAVISQEMIIKAKTCGELYNIKDYTLIAVQKAPISTPLSSCTLRIVDQIGKGKKKHLLRVDGEKGEEKSNNMRPNILAVPMFVFDDIEHHRHHPHSSFHL
jgi:hypothetical protein